MNFAVPIDFKSISTLDVARELLGPEDRERSTRTEKHFSGHNGLFINVVKNVWRSHGNGVGGDALDLVCYIKSCDKSAGISWLRSGGHIDGRQAPAKPSLRAIDSPPRRVVHTYDYCDADGKASYHVDRTEPKGPFPTWRSIDGVRVDGVVADTYQRVGDRWKRLRGEPPRPGAETIELPDIVSVPYRLPELLASGDAPVLIPAGEKDVDNLRALGFTATCNHGGEGKFWEELIPYFEGRRAFLLVDNDEQGEKHQQVVGAALNGTASEIKVVRFAELAEKGADVSDFIEQRRKDGIDSSGIKRELAKGFSEAPTWEPTATEPTTSHNVTEVEWPEPTSIPEGLSPVAAFDTDFLPGKLVPGSTTLAIGCNVRRTISGRLH
jgi:5S rRNA maturation endonuclease (ribonuclease M5)